MKRWLEPVRIFRDLEEEIKRTMEDFWGRRRRFPILSEELSPAVDIYEKGEDIIVKAEIPGVEKEDISVSVSEETITIKGEIKREEEVKERDYYRSERLYGSFSRTLELPAEVDVGKVKASYKNGVLTVTLVKKKPERKLETEIKIE